jgi:hypothetical protein
MTRNARPVRFSRKEKDLPGYWAVLFVRAVVADPAKCSLDLTGYVGRECFCLQDRAALGHLR